MDDRKKLDVIPGHVTYAPDYKSRPATETKLDLSMLGKSESDTRDARIAELESELHDLNEWVEKLRKPLKWIRSCAESEIVISHGVIKSIVGEALDALEKLRSSSKET